jgi:hypothetical protein
VSNPSVYAVPPPTPGQVAYEASAATFPPKARKQQVPWRDIGAGPQAHWEAIAQAVAGPLLGLLDDFTHAVIDLDDGARLVSIDRIASAARSVRKKAGLPELPS